MFLWDVSTGQKIRRFRGHDSAVNAVSFAADDQVVITAGYDRAVKIWDARSNSIDPIQSVVAWRDAVTSLTVAGHCITGGSVDGTLRTLDVRAGRMHVDDLGRGRAGPGGDDSSRESLHVPTFTVMVLRALISYIVSFCTFGGASHFSIKAAFTSTPYL